MEKFPVKDQMELCVRPHPRGELIRIYGICIHMTGIHEDTVLNTRVLVYSLKVVTHETSVVLCVITQITHSSVRRLPVPLLPSSIRDIKGYAKLP